MVTTTEEKGRPSLETIALCHEIGDDVFFYEPSNLTAPGNSSHRRRSSNSNSNSSHADPSLIVLCTWLGGATIKRVSKLVLKYTSLFPDSAILVIRTTMLDYAGRPASMIRARLTPARDAIARVTSPAATSAGTSKVHGQITTNNDDDDDDDDDKSRVMAGHSASSPPRAKTVLMHVFSNGGTNIAIHLLQSLRDQKIPFPLAALIFDCCPSLGRFWHVYRASTFSIPPGALVQTIGRAALIAGVGASTLLGWAGYAPYLTRMRAQLNDPAIVDPRVRRLYLSSKTDDLTPWDEIVSHADEASLKGLQVESVVFDEAAHCALILADEEKYGRIIAEFWNDKKPRTIATPRPPQPPPPPPLKQVAEAGRASNPDSQTTPTIRSKL